MTSFAPEPLYVSKRMPRNLWQEYRVFSDRIEIQCRVLLGTFVIPFDDIAGVSLSRALTIEIFRAFASAIFLPRVTESLTDEIDIPSFRAREN